MTSEAELLQVGDIFTSKSLVNAVYVLDHQSRGPNHSKLEVGYPRYVTLGWTESGEDGWKRHREELIDLDATDPSRGEAEFLVVHTELSGGGSAQGGDYYHPGWGVRARRLDAGGGLYGSEEEVFFRQTGCFCNRLDDVVKVGRLVPLES